MNMRGSKTMNEKIITERYPIAIFKCRNAGPVGDFFYSIEGSEDIYHYSRFFRLKHSHPSEFSELINTEKGTIDDKARSGMGTREFNGLVSNHPDMINCFPKDQILIYKNTDTMEFLSDHPQSEHLSTKNLLDYMDSDGQWLESPKSN